MSDFSVFYWTFSRKLFIIEWIFMADGEKDGQDVPGCTDEKQHERNPADRGILRILFSWEEEGKVTTL